MEVIRDDHMETIARMRNIDTRFQLASGLRSRRYYTIFCSRIDPASGLVFGLHPGGDPVNWRGSQLVSGSFFEGFEHTCVDCFTEANQMMRPFLRKVFRTDDAGVRRIPKTNVAFRRFPRNDGLDACHGMTMEEARIEAKPFVQEIISQVNPSLIILEGMQLLQVFYNMYCSPVGPAEIDVPMHLRWKGRIARVYSAQELHVNCLCRRVPVAALVHPMHFHKHYPKHFEQMTQRVEKLAESL